MRLLLIAAITALLAIPGGAVAQPHKQPKCSVTASQFRPFADEAWDLTRWQRPKPKHTTVKAKRHKIGCAVGPGHRKAMRHEWSKDRVQFGRYRVYRQIATWPGPGSGERSPSDGRWWVIPWYIVCGESGGDFFPDFGNTKDGAYQIIPSTWAAHGGLTYASYPSYATPLQQHRVASAVVGSSGFGAWYGRC